MAQVRRHAVYAPQTHPTHKRTNGRTLTPCPIRTVLCPAHSPAHPRNPSLVSSPSTSRLRPEALSLPLTSPTYVSFRCCSVLLPPGSSLAQGWGKYLCPGSRNMLCILPAFALEIAGCLSITPAGHGIAPSGQEFSLCFPSTQ